MAILHGKEQRDALYAAKARVRELEEPAREAQKIARAKGKRDRERRVGETAEGQRKPPQKDRDYVSWLHEGLPCVACETLGPPANPGRVEAAHIWLVEGPMKGKRNSDRFCLPICRWHHRDAPNACDVAQRAFFDRLRIDAAGITSALYGAFKGGADGAAVIRQFAREARA